MDHEPHGRESMNIPILKDQLRCVGLTLDEKNTVSDGVFEYFKLKDDVLESVKGERFEVEAIGGFAYTPTEHVIRLDMGEEEETLIYGGKFPDPVVILRDMPTTSSALSAVWDELYPLWRTQLYYDELEEKEMMDMSMIGRADLGVQPISDAVLAQFHIHLESTLTDMGFIGKKFPSRAVMDEVMIAKLADNRRNSFREWVESHEWDGQARLRMWFRDTLGASAPPLRGEDDVVTEEELKYIGDVTEAWFIGAIKRMYQETKHEIVPVLIGNQAAGKSSTLKYLAGADKWYRDTSSDVSDPSRFLDTVRGAVIVELAESSSMRNSDQEKLKAFISSSSDRLRKAYARMDMSYPRHFIMIATSNLDNIFTDVTGNRRFFPMYCEGNGTRKVAIEHRGAKASYEVEQLWAEALFLYKHGRKWFLDMETKRLAKKVQAYGTVEHPGITAINAFLDDPANGYHTVGSRVCRKIIVEEVFHMDAAHVPKDIEANYRAWANSTQHWVKSTPFRYAGSTHRGYERAYLAEEEPVFKAAKLVSGYDSEWDAETNARDDFNEIYDIPLEDVMRQHCERYHLMYTGEDFPTDGLTAQQVDSMFLNGYIYNVGTITKPSYRLGFIP